MLFSKAKEKKRLLLILSMVLVLGFIIATGWMRKVSAVNEDTYEHLKIFTDILSVVQKNYVEEVDSKKLIYGAINGMLQVLDPHSSFMTPEIFKELKVETKGMFGGLGIVITLKEGILMVIAPIEDTPAFRAGIEAGDHIVKINGESTKNTSLLEAVKLMRGTPGTQVTISIMRKGLSEPKDYTITRAIIKIKSVESRLLEDGAPDECIWRQRFPALYPSEVRPGACICRLVLSDLQMEGGDTCWVHWLQGGQDRPCDPRGYKDYDYR